MVAVIVATVAASAAVVVLLVVLVVEAVEIEVIVAVVIACIVEVAATVVVTVTAIVNMYRTSRAPVAHRRRHDPGLELLFPKVLEGMVARRDSPDSETWLLLLNAVGTADSLDKAVALMERSRAEGNGSEVLFVCLTFQR